MNKLEIIGKRLKKLRSQTDWTQQDIADKLDVSKSTYGYYENGDRNLNASVLLELSKIFKVSIDYILGISDYPETSEHYLDKLSGLNINKDLLKDEETVAILNKIFYLSEDTKLTKNKLKALLNVFHSFKHYVIISTDEDLQ